MKQLLTFLFAIILFSCKSSGDDYHKPEDALDAGREFIQQSLKGRFNTARKYMLVDKDNTYWLDKASEEFNKKNEEEKTGFSEASINILEVSDVVADSITIISFSNSFKKRTQKIKVVKYNDEWKVDFKYTFSGNL